MDGESHEHGDEEDPEDDEDADARLADDLGDDAEDGERHCKDDPSEHLHEPVIAVLNESHEGMNDSTTLVWLAMQAAKRGADTEGEEDNSDDVAGRKRRHDGAGNVGREVFDRTLRPGLYGCGGACRWLGVWHDVQQFVDVAVPGETRLPGIHDHEANCHGYGDVDETDEEQLGPLT
ncbi:MAG: hypothetical protein JW395_3143 [Nitrospira sp.]|nr:hypothetical protein [Nitrospira sp.]